MKGYSHIELIRRRRKNFLPTIVICAFLVLVLSYLVFMTGPDYLTITVFILTLFALIFFSLSFFLRNTNAIIVSSFISLFFTFKILHFDMTLSFILAVIAEIFIILCLKIYFNHGKNK